METICFIQGPTMNAQRIWMHDETEKTYGDHHIIYMTPTMHAYDDAYHKTHGDHII